MNNWKEVEVGWAGDIDSNLLPIVCLCGYGGYWEFVISVGKELSQKCPKCGRRYYFENEITVFVNERELKDD